MKMIKKILMLSTMLIVFLVSFVNVNSSSRVLEAHASINTKIENSTIDMSSNGIVPDRITFYDDNNALMEPTKTTEGIEVSSVMFMQYHFKGYIVSDTISINMSSIIQAESVGVFTTATILIDTYGGSNYGQGANMIESSTEITMNISESAKRNVTTLGIMIGSVNETSSSMILENINISYTYQTDEYISSKIPTVTPVEQVLIDSSGVKHEQNTVWSSYAFDSNLGLVVNENNIDLNPATALLIQNLSSGSPDSIILHKDKVTLNIDLATNGQLTEDIILTADLIIGYDYFSAPSIITNSYTITPTFVKQTIGLELDLTTITPFDMLSNLSVRFSVNYAQNAESSGSLYISGMRLNYSSVDMLDIVHRELVNIIMNDDLTEQCKTKFYLARAELLSMSDSDIELFKTASMENFAVVGPSVLYHVRVRYEAWAISLGEEAYLNSSYLNTSSLQSNDLLMICVISSVLLIIPVTYIAYIKKKKHI